MKTNILRICRKEALTTPLTTLDWGHRYHVGSEQSALRIAYAHREAPHGVKVEGPLPDGTYTVTVWNDKAKEMGCDI